MDSFNQGNRIDRSQFQKEIAHFWMEINKVFRDDPELVTKVIVPLLCTDTAMKYTYNIYPGVKYNVFETARFKLTIAEDESYHCFFNKHTGVNVRFGTLISDDPKYCPLGPEILDLEVSVNGCVPVPGSTNCRYCYKNNTNATPTNMTFETFEKILKRFPKNLSQIAFGITGLQTNPDLTMMFKYCLANGVVPNVTTVGADMTDDILDALCCYCGAVAVSCYTGAKELCYKTIKQIKDYAKQKYQRDMHVNMHIVISRDNMQHLMDVLNDIKDGKVEGLRSVVLLRIKPKGRASKMDCRLSKSDYQKVISFCLDNHISFGFDSCSAYMVETVLTEMGHPEYVTSIEKCESGLLSSYINVKGEYWNCSFAENTDFIKPIDVLKHDTILEWWNGPELTRIRNYPTPACESCPIYNLDEMT